MSRSSGRDAPVGRGRGQVEPVAALVALAVVCAALSLYAGVLDGALAGVSTDDDGPAEQVADRVRDRVAPAGVAAPPRLSAVTDGYRFNATLACRERAWTTGAPPPVGASRAREPVSVRVAPGVVRPCRLVVVVWS
ncbi:DUF7285 family protein [Halomarina oriensis]|uniref:Uncharacterized protein n=1 Tax=Halomarina oriensis TaxID=671145 RepID=A0A6B0GKH0_9EURY|nr:hypothetical protein [Halomarina oriensis]MWG35426.1 hypothetical protein [Halomarina oriensis]